LIEKVSVNDAGQQVGNFSSEATISADGRRVAFIDYHVYMRDWGHNDSTD
jgi:hypothetical protein